MSLASLRFVHHSDIPSSAWSHWGCSASYLQKLKASYDSVDQVEGYSDLKDAEKEKAQRAYEDCDIPEEDRGIGEAVEGLEKEKKKAAPRKKKKTESEEDHDDEEEEEERPKKKVRKAKVRDKVLFVWCQSLNANKRSEGR